MVIRLSFVGLALACCVSLGEWSHAGVVLSLTPSTPTVVIPTGAGTTQFSVEAGIAADPVPGTQLFRGYNLPVQITPPGGTALPTGWSIVGVSVINEIPGDPPFSSRVIGGNPAPQEGVVFASDSTLFGNPVNLTTATLPLFNFTVEVNSQAVAGNYEASIINGATFSVVDDMGNAINQVAFGTGNVQLVNVPEPSTATLGLLSVVFCLSRTRRNRSATLAA